MAITQNQKIILRAEDNTKLYPRALASELIKDDESAFVPQEKLTAGNGVVLDDSTNALSSNITVNGQLPVETILPGGATVFNFELDSVNRTIDSVPTNGSNNLVSSNGIYKSTTKLYRYSTRIMVESVMQGSANTLIGNLFTSVLTNLPAYAFIARYYFTVSQAHVGEVYESQIFGLGQNFIQDGLSYPTLYYGDRVDDPDTGFSKIRLQDIQSWIINGLDQGNTDVIFHIEVLVPGDGMVFNN